MSGEGADRPAAGRIVLGEVIGRGGFGTVHRAWLHGELLRREVAVKLLRAEHAANPHIAGRLRDEARMLSCLHHRAVVRVEDVVELGGAAALVMELVRGQPLSELIARHGHLPPGPALEIVCEVAGALAWAWEGPGPDGAPLRLLHRDIKPANILLTPLGEVKLLDFGIARAALAERESKTTSLGFGTPEYMAPERFDAQDMPAGDVYALGATLLELLTGTAPARSSARQERHLDVWGQSLERAAQAGLDGEVVRLISEVLAYAPEQRPTAQDLVVRCEDILRAGRTGSLRAWAAAHVVAPVAAGPSLPTLAPAMGAPPPSAETLAPAAPTSAPLSERPRRRTALVLALAAAAVLAVVGIVGVSGVGLLASGALQSEPAPDEDPPTVDPPAEIATAAPEPETTSDAAVASTPPAEDPPAVSPAEAAPAPSSTVSARPAASAPAGQVPDRALVAVALTGGASAVRLRGSDGSFALPASVPPGRYDIWAVFGDAAEMGCGQAIVREGSAPTVHTDATFTSCELRP